MKIKFLKLKNWLLLTVMGALGMSACQCHKRVAQTETKPETPAVEPGRPSVEDRGEIRLMYGVPTMNFMIQGRVHDADGRPVQGIRVMMLENGIEATADTVYGDPERVKEYLENSSVATDKDGRFAIQRNDRPLEQVRVLVRDVDGSTSGNYRNQLIEMKVAPGDVDRTNAGGWNQGTYNKVMDIQLEEK